MTDLTCKLCQSLLNDPVLVGCGKFHNICSTCVPKLKKTCPYCDGNIIEGNKRPNVTLNYLIDQLFHRNDAPAALTTLLDPLSIFPVLSGEPFPYDLASEYSLSVVAQAPERFSTSLDFVAVIDLSASMKGTKFQLLVETVDFFIDNLTENDRFGIVAFQGEARRVFDIDHANPQNKQKWKTKLRSYEPKSKSNLCAGILEGLEMLNQLRNRRMNSALMVFTDGQATKGITDEKEIIANIQDFITRHNLKVALHTFGYRRHQVNLMKSLSEIRSGQYFFIQKPIEISQSLAISFTDLRRSHFHNVKINVATGEGVTIRQIGSSLSISPVMTEKGPSMKNGCIVDIGQLAERRQKNILFRVNLPKLIAPSSKFIIMDVKLTYDDISLSIERSTQTKILLKRDVKLADSPPLIENEQITEQWNRHLTGQAIYQAALDGRATDTVKQGIALLDRTIDAVGRVDGGIESKERGEAFVTYLAQGKKMLEKHAPLDDTHFGKLVDISNAFTHEISSVFVDLFHTEPIEAALTEINETVKETANEANKEAENEPKSSQKIVKKEEAKPPGDKFVKYRNMNTFGRFKSRKEQEMVELYSKLSKQKLSPSEIEARISRGKKEHETKVDDELARKFKKIQQTQSKPYITLKMKKPNKLDNEEEEEEDHEVTGEITHQAIYDFEARNDVEISLKQGDPIFVTKVRTDQFLEGKNLRTLKQGLFPKNYVATVLVANNEQIAFPTHHALYDFFSRNGNELDLRKNDSVIVLKQRNDGFMEGVNTSTNKTGLFPITHVTPSVTHKIKADFQPGMGNEIELKKDDLVVVVQAREDGWLKGLNTRTNQIGLFPSSFASPLSHN